MDRRSYRAYVKLSEEVETLGKVVYKSRNSHRPTKVFRKLVQLKRSCISFLSDRSETKVNFICRICEDLYILATSNIPDGYFVGYTLIVLGMCSRIHYLIKEVECVKCKNDIDEMFEGIE